MTHRDLPLLAALSPGAFEDNAIAAIGEVRNELDGLLSSEPECHFHFVGRLMTTYRIQSPFTGTTAAIRRMEKPSPGLIASISRNAVNAYSLVMGASRPGTGSLCWPGWPAESWYASTQRITIHSLNACSFTLQSQFLPHPAEIIATMGRSGVRVFQVLQPLDNLLSCPRVRRAGPG